jgi:hypothetical protein
MSRNGKIARLPGQIREEIDRRLYDGEDGKKILGWLNSVDEVKAILAEKFNGRPITKGNLCEWRQGGHRDWEMQQATLDETHRVVSEGLELDKAGEKALADKLAVWLVGRYVLVTRQLIENENDPAAWKLLRELCHDVVALRRGDHGAEWLRLEQERLELQRQKQQSDREKLKEEILKENPPVQVLSDEEKERRWNQIFGINPDSYPMYGGRNPFDPTPDPAAPPAPPPEASPAASFLNPNPNFNLPSSEEDSDARELRRVMDLAEKGDAYGQYCLATRYRDGFGVPKDLAKAREWLEKAASQGIGSAKIELHALLMRWDPEAQQAFDRPN